LAIQSMNLRGGLPLLSDKLKRNEPVFVAFLGGSITEGYGASEPDESSWRALIGKYFVERFSTNKVTCINAGIGGTTSTFGAHRLQEHVLSHGKIDLLFVEFSVNDSDNRVESIRGMEGIVRQCRRKSPRTEIVFVYTAADKNLAEDIPFNIAVHEEVAIHYGIPSVNFAARIRELVASGEVSWEELANDRVHPNDAGYALYAKYMQEYLELALIDKAASGVDSGIGGLPLPLEKSSYEHASMQGFQAANSLEGFTVVSVEPGAMMNWRYQIDHLHTEKPGASLTFSVTGQGAGLLLLHGPDSGIFEYSLDGASYTQMNLFDEWCVGAYRPVLAMLSLQPERSDFRVTIRNTALKDERSTGTGLRILKLLSN